MKQYLTAEEKTRILDRLEECALTQGQYPADDYELETFILRYILIHADNEKSIVAMFHEYQDQIWKENTGGPDADN